MKRTAHQDVVEEVMHKLKTGTPAGKISIDAKLSVLRDRTVHWMWSAYTELNNPRIVRKLCCLLSLKALASHEFLP